MKNTSSMHQHENGWSTFHRLEKESNSPHIFVFYIIFMIVILKK
jgi:hypothetical protein